MKTKTARAAKAVKGTRAKRQAAGKRQSAEARLWTMATLRTFQHRYGLPAGWLAAELGFHVNTLYRMLRGELAAGNRRMLELALGGLAEKAAEWTASRVAEGLTR